jgi:DNA replication and repair protein RecF
MSLHLGRIPLTAVLPSDTELILGGGTERRAWLDALISQFNADYLNALIAYEKALTQRNALLQSFLEHHTFDAQQLEPWTLQLAEKGSLIARGRLQFLADFSPQFISFYQKMIAEGETPRLQYQTAWDPNQELTPEYFLAFLQQNIARDCASGRTQAGIHRDDLIFLLNERSVRYYGSQGQQKTFVTALQLAQYDFLQKQTGKTPILLLDDVFDKLDEYRVKHIVHRLTLDTGGQVFLTDTSLARLKHLFPEEKSDIWGFYRIENGLLFPV